VKKLTKIKKKMKALKLKMTALTIGLLVVTLNSSNAQDAKGMANYIYNFIKFIDWPVSAQKGEFVIGVVGETAVYKELEKIVNGRKAYNQPIILKKFTDPSSIGACHVIFVPDNYSEKINCLLSKTKINHTLIICEKSGMVKKGSCISFAMQDLKLTYEVNRTNIENSGLYIDNKLELLASNIK
jgi:hypothetical protein